MNRRPSAKEHCRKATPYNTQHTSTVVEVIARCRYALIVRSRDGQGPRREEVDEEEEKHYGLVPRQ
jgi:hypothetical protein